MVDGLGIGDVGSIVLKDRQHLSQDGLIIVYIRESENLMEDMKQALRRKLAALEEAHITDWAIIKLAVKDTLKDVLMQKNRRNPMVLPIIMEV